MKRKVCHWCSRTQFTLINANSRGPSLSTGGTGIKTLTNPSGSCPQTTSSAKILTDLKIKKSSKDLSQAEIKQMFLFVLFCFCVVLLSFRSAPRGGSGGGVGSSAAVLQVRSETIVNRELVSTLRREATSKMQ